MIDSWSDGGFELRILGSVMEIAIGPELEILQMISRTVSTFSELGETMYELKMECCLMGMYPVEMMWRGTGIGGARLPFEVTLVCRPCRTKDEGRVVFNVLVAWLLQDTFPIVSLKYP